MGHSHGSHSHPAGRYLRWAIILNVALVAVQIVVGIYANSLALLADSAHNLVDVIALVTSWWAIQIAKRPSSSHRTFGYHRVGIVAALANAVTLVVTSGLISWEAFRRMQEPPEVQALTVILVSIAAIGLNGLSAWWLWRGAKRDLNIRSAFLHLVGDAASSAGVVLTGVIIMLTGWWVVDPIGSVLIAVLILWSSWGILRDSLNVLLESAPSDVDMVGVEGALRSIPGVRDVHDLHVWTVGSGRVAGTCHLVMSDRSLSEAQAAQQSAKRMLHEKFRISHSTIQVEVEGCDPNDLYCEMKDVDEACDKDGHAHEHPAP